MKNYMNLFLMAVATILVAASCESNNVSTAENTVNADQAKVTRAAGVEQGTQTIEFQGKTINLTAEDIIQITQEVGAADADVVSKLNSKFMGAEKTAQTLDVTFTAADEPVENGMFIFGIQTEEGKDLVMEVFDEEGFAMVANNQFSVTEGNNYKALNVNSLDNGVYNFRLKDQEGKELNRQVKVANPE